MRAKYSLSWDAMIYKNPEGVYLNLVVVAVLAVIFIMVGSLFTRWKEK